MIHLFKLYRLVKKWGAMGMLSILLSCATAKKEGCATSDWAEYGEAIGIKGLMLKNDKNLLECRMKHTPIDENHLLSGYENGRSKFCQPGSAFYLGKKGEPLVTSVCSPDETRSMQEQYKIGLKNFCTLENGEKMGSLGKDNPALCPPEYEAFKTGYNSGRKEFLNAQITSAKTDLQNLNAEIQNMRTQADASKTKMSDLENDRSIKLIDEAAPNPDAQKEIQHIESEMSAVQSLVNRLSGELSEKIDKQKKLLKNLSSWQKELNILSVL